MTRIQSPHSGDGQRLDEVASHVLELRVRELTPYPRKARTHSKKWIRQIADSIERFGFINPVLIDDQSGILAGHGRVEAARSLGMDSVPCLR